MINSSLKKKVEGLLAEADIRIGGKRPGDITVHNPKLYSRVLAGGSLALGEAYMDGWWDCKDLDVFAYKILKADLNRKIISPKMIAHYIKATLLNQQTKHKSKKVTHIHYDLGNDFYQAMLDKRMQYTCGYFKDTKDLDKAQEQKLDLICRKLKLKKTDKVLELGAGFGGFARFAAEKYGCHVTSYNISKEQVRFAREYTKGLPVKIILADYREAKGEYDKVVSIGMCEHVGYKNYKTFMKTAHRCLKKGGLFLIHTIGHDVSRKSTDPWISKYIFPNSLVPSSHQLIDAQEGLFILEDWHNFGAYYDTTLMAWNHNFEKNWKKFRPQYGETFYRMWRYYLLMCAGLFRARKAQLWHIVLSKGGVEGGYESIR